MQIYTARKHFIYVTGLGFAFLTISANQAASLCFEGHARLIGLSVVSSAIGIGGMVYPYLLVWMEDSYGLRGTFLLLGGITLNGIPMSLLWKHLNQSIQLNREGDTSPGDLSEITRVLLSRVTETLKSKPFVAALIGFTMAMPSVNMFEILSLDVLETNGLTRNTSVTLFIILNAVSIPGRLVPGLVQRIRGLSSMIAPILGVLISGLGMILINATHTVAGMVVFCLSLLNPRINTGISIESTIFNHETHYAS